MPYDAIEYLDLPIDSQRLRDRIERLTSIDAARYRRLWNYYRNPMLPVSVDVTSDGSDRPYRQAQEWGLPSRITGVVTRSLSSGVTDAQPVEGVARKDVVIENDIAWRIETMVDYLFGKPIVIHSKAPDPSRRVRIEALVRTILLHNGGITFLQQLALMGAVYGFVDVLVKFDCSRCSETTARTEKRTDPTPDGSGPSAGPDACDGSHTPPAGPAAVTSRDVDATPDDGTTASSPSSSSPVDDTGPHPGASEFSRDDAIERIARTVRLEIVEPSRALPLVCATDWRTVEAYVQVYRIARQNSGKRDGRKIAPLRVAAKSGLLHKLLDRFAATRRGAHFSSDSSDDFVTVTELLTPNHWQRYADETLVASGANSLGVLPLVHIQNAAVPFEYAGASDVEALIPLQDELNTRLSDRAHRIALQSFRMYLGKGIENFTSMPVAPGRMWMTDNEQAEVIEFGGDASAPSEDRHIEELREAMDKTSGVSPIAAGAIKGRIGRLTSAAALRVTMLALLAKTERKRTTYGEAIVKMCELSLAWLDRAGVFPTHADERHFEIHWPNPLPANEIERLEEAKLKRDLGVSEPVVLRELGY